MRIIPAVAALWLFSLVSLGMASAQPAPSFIAMWGSFGSGPGQLYYPYGITISPDGFVYVSDQYNFRIVQYTTNGQFVRSWGSRGRGPGQFDLTIGLGIDPAGHVYVADYGNSRVQVFNRDGVFLRQWPAQDARDVAMSPDGSVHVVAVRGSQVDVFTPDGNPVRSYGGGEIGSPTSIAFDAAGNSYVVNEGGPGNGSRQTVTKWSPAGALLAMWGSGGTGPGHLGGVAGVAVDATGNVYVVEHQTNRLQVFDPAGSLIGLWGTTGSGAGQFIEPVDVALDAAGLIYVVDMYNHRIQKFGNLPVMTSRVSWGALKSRFR